MRLGKLLCLAVSAAVVVPLAACGSSGGNGGTSTSSSISIGFLGDLTGPLAVYGGIQSDAFKARVAQVNAAGGAGGHQIKLVSEDAGGDSAKQVANALELIQSHHVAALVGMVTSDECAAVAPLAKAHQTPLVCLGAPASLTHPSTNDFVFNYSPLSVNFVDPMYAYGGSLVGSGDHRVALVAEDVAEDRDWLTGAQAKFKGAGWDVPVSQIIAAGGSDASGLAAKIAAAKPSLVEYVVGSADQLSLVKALRQDGYTGPLVAAPLSFDYGVLSQLADPANFVLSNTTLADPKAATGDGATYVKAMASVGKTAPGDLNFQTAQIDYVGAWAVTSALATCASGCAGPALVTALEGVSLKLPGLVDTYTWSKQIHDPATSAVVNHWDPATSSIVSSALPTS